MNEWIFFLHLLFVIVFILIGKKIGKEGLMGLFALQLIICNLFVPKQIDLFGFSATGCDAYCVGGLFCLSILQKLYGEKWAYLTILLGFFLLIFFGFATQFHLFYSPNTHDITHPSYSVVLGLTPKLIMSSLFVNFMTQNLTIGLNKLFFKLTKLPSIFRLLLPIALAQLFDTITFTLIALRGTMHNLTDIIILSYTIKMLATLVLSPSLFLATKPKLTLKESP